MFCLSNGVQMGFSCIDNYEAAVSVKVCAASGCSETQADSHHKHH